MTFKATKKGSAKRASLAQKEYPQWSMKDISVFDSIEKGCKTVAEIIDDLTVFTAPQEKDILEQIGFLKVHGYVVEE